MLSFAFFYFVGQNIAWLLSSWMVSGLVCTIIPVVVLLMGVDHGSNSLTVFVGWASVVVVPEFIFKIEHSTFDGDIKNQLLPILAVFDALIFVALTIIVNMNDSAPAVWIFLLAAHALYVNAIWHINNYAKRVHTPYRYFATYMGVLLANDIFFLIVSLIIHGHPLNFISVLIAGVLTTLQLVFMARTPYFSQWLEGPVAAPE